MNPKIDSYLRHVFTAWITAAVVALTAWFTLPEADAKAVADGFAKIGDGVLIVLAVVVPALGRLVWAWISNALRDGKPGDGGTGLGLVWIGTAAVAMGGLLPSCSSPLPITGSVSYLNPRTGAKAGLVFDPATPPRARIALPILDADTGEQVGFAELQTLHGQIAE